MKIELGTVGALEGPEHEYVTIDVVIRGLNTKDLEPGDIIVIDGDGPRAMHVCKQEFGGTCSNPQGWSNDG